MKRAAILLIPLIAISFLAGYHTGKPDYILGEYEGRGIQVQLEVYKNGELVYYDPDDPATKQFTMLIAELIAGNIVTDMQATDGTLLHSIANSARPGYMFISYDNVNYTYTMYTLPQNIEQASIGAGAVSFNDQEKSVTLSTSINIQTGGNITAVGLYTTLSMYISSSSGYDKNILLFYDPLPTPLAVSPGDVVTVVYKIVVP